MAPGEPEERIRAGDPSVTGAGQSALADATFDALARNVDEARRYARMLHYGRTSGVWDPVWFGVPDGEDAWPAWLTSVGDDYAAAWQVSPELESVAAAGSYALRLRFADGVTGVVDTTPHLWGPAFQPLHDPAYFAQVRLEDGAPRWPNGADIAPEVLYREVLRNPADDPHVDLNIAEDRRRPPGGGCQGRQHRAADRDGDGDG